MNASLNKWILLPSIVSLMALALSGCEEEDVFFGVGINNKQRAAQVMFFEYKDQPAYQYNGVEYSKDVYEADYVAKGSSNPNTNSFRGVVDCTIVNDVAADFLEREIKRYY